MAAEVVFRRALVVPFTSRLELAERWHDVLTNLGEEGLTQAYKRVAAVHPGLLPVLHQMDDAISGVMEFTSEWEFCVPHVSVPAEHAGEVARLSKLHARQSKPSRKLNDRLLLVCGSVIVLALMAILRKDYRAFAPWIGLFGAFGLHMLRNHLKDPVLLLQRAEQLQARVRRLIDVSGMFRHEALAAIVGRRAPRHVKVGRGFFAIALLDPLTTLAEEPPLELGLLSEAHLARLRLERAAKQETRS